MRVLTITNLFPPVSAGGYERRCAAVIEGLRDALDIRVLTSDRRRSSVRDDRADVFRELPWYPTPPRRGHIGAVSMAAKTAKITRRHLDEFEPDIAYVWHIGDVSQACLAVCLERPNLKVVLNMGDYWLQEPFVDPFTRSLFGAGSERFSRRFPARILNCIMPNLRLRFETPRPVEVQWITDHLRAATQVPAFLQVTDEAVINPFSPHEADMRATKRRRSADPTFVFAGRISRDKGPDVLVRAAALLQARVLAPVNVVIAGPVEDVDYARQIRALVAESDLRDDLVSMPGPLSAPELSDCLASATALVQPSLWDEPGGLVALDAAVAGVPVIASQVGGIPELLRPREHAWGFQRGDVAGCALMMQRVLDDPVEAQARADRASARMHELTAERYVSRTMSFLGMDAPVATSTTGAV